LVFRIALELTGLVVRSKGRIGPSEDHSCIDSIVGAGFRVGRCCSAKQGNDIGGQWDFLASVGQGSDRRGTPDYASRFGV
jgi:hypothetical protein